VTAAASSVDYFLRAVQERLISRPELVGKVVVKEQRIKDQPRVEIEIPKRDPGGFDVSLAFFDNWEIFVYADQTTVSFFLSNSPRDEAQNRQRIDECVSMVLQVLGPSHRLRQTYRGQEAYRGVLEELSATGWVAKARWSKLMLWRHFFGKKTERVFQNRFLEA